MLKLAIVSKEIFMIFTLIFTLVGCTANPHKTEIELNNRQLFNYSEPEPPASEAKEVSLDEYEEALLKIKSFSHQKRMDDVLISVNDVEITRREFEERRILKELQYDITYNEILYGLIKSLVIKLEAEKLGLEPSQKQIDEILSSLEFVELDQYSKVYLDVNDITMEQFLAEQERKAYDTALRTAYYEHVQKEDGFVNIDCSVEDLIKKANIVFYDSEFEEKCKMR